ncbi:MAG: KTSC domain-containing protein [Chitinophagaceae bacterium]
MPSSVIAGMNYSAVTSTLQVIFLSGRVYEYKNVPEQVYLDMKRSGSKGSYLNQHIKGSYPFRKIR